MRSTRVSRHINAPRDKIYEAVQCETRAVLVRMRVSEFGQVVEEELPEPLGDLVLLLGQLA